MSESASASASASAAGLVSGDKANPVFKIVGIALAVGSGVFIGASFVVKKKGLINATLKAGNAAGEGHAYLKNWIWWTGLIMMVVGEILNFVAYAFTEAILVTPLGALSVVISAILSHFFLKETLTLFGWVGCALCIIGATILALNAPEQQSVTKIEDFKRLFLSPGFLVWGSLCLLVSGVLMTYGAKRWGKTHMMVYIGICSLVGGISVSCTQGLGASIVTSIGGDNQVKNWFWIFLLFFVIITLLTEINYLNKALELFNTSMVVPVYFCVFTTCVLITRQVVSQYWGVCFILYQGLKAPVISLITMVLGFIIICLGITLLQMSKVDPTKLKGLGRRTTILMQAAREPVEHNSEKEEVSHFEDPGMDALRGGFGAVGSVIRARSVSRRMSLSQAGLSGGKRWYEMGQEANMSTHGLENLRRYQLSDAPMPADAMDKISQHTKSPTIPRPPVSPNSAADGHESFFPPRSKSHLKFEEEDVVHQYDPNRPHIAISVHPPATPRRHQTYPTVLESPEEESSEMGRPRAITSPEGQETRFAGDPERVPGPYPYDDPYAPSRGVAPDETAARPRGALASLFHLSTGPSPKSSHTDLRSGATSGGSEYPKRRVEGEDPEERARLFGGRPSDDLYRGPSLEREVDSSPENSPVRYAHRRF